MKWLAQWDMAPEDLDVNLKKYAELLEARAKKDPKFPLNPLSDNYVFPGEYRGFIIYGDDATDEQLTNVTLHFKDTMAWTFEPIMTAAKWIEIYQKSRK
ncbi:hypothetical protein KEJ21_03220 [Candidatus Bathyarchaeota archaeon]|nr:hypothetical protein [Candidatus Bathyarchaeota archaeon]MBS7630489.1 hypothetical protein [Candidatus Bathyarchaeota archaeon]